MRALEGGIVEREIPGPGWWSDQPWVTTAAIELLANRKASDRERSAAARWLREGPFRRPVHGARFGARRHLYTKAFGERLAAMRQADCGPGVCQFVSPAMLADMLLACALIEAYDACARDGRWRHFRQRASTAYEIDLLGHPHEEEVSLDALQEQGWQTVEKIRYKVPDLEARQRRLDCEELAGRLVADGGLDATAANMLAWYEIGGIAERALVARNSNLKPGTLRQRVARLRKVEAVSRILDAHKSELESRAADDVTERSPSTITATNRAANVRPERRVK